MLDITKFEKAVAAKAAKMTVRERYNWQKKLQARGDAAEMAGNPDRSGLFAVAWMAVLMGA